MDGGGHSFITANGTTGGILWLNNGGKIYALDAISFKTLYTTGQAPNQRDKVPPVPHFAAPIVADGKLFIGTMNSLVTYGLLSNTAAPQMGK